MQPLHLSPRILDLLLKRTVLTPGAFVRLLGNALQPPQERAMSNLDVRELASHHMEIIRKLRAYNRNGGCQFASPRIGHFTDKVYVFRCQAVRHRPIHAGVE
jgi:hypothetical protein